jgi:hypothetical protein
MFQGIYPHAHQPIVSRSMECTNYHQVVKINDEAAHGLVLVLCT